MRARSGMARSSTKVRWNLGRLKQVGDSGKRRKEAARLGGVVSGEGPRRRPDGRKPTAETQEPDAVVGPHARRVWVVEPCLCTFV